MAGFIIAVNDAHGLASGNRTPIMPFVGRSFYENEANALCKTYFAEECLRCGLSIYDVKPESNDVDTATRMTRLVRSAPDVCVTFSYGAYGSGRRFNSKCGVTARPSSTRFSALSRALSQDVAERFNQDGMTCATEYSIGAFDTVNCPSIIVECGHTTNFAEAKLMHDPDYLQRCAHLAFMGVCDFLNYSRIESDKTTLDLGSKGNHVKIAQYLLSLYGYVVVKDGYFGANTQAAVKAFQSANNIRAIGIVDEDTWNALYKVNTDIDFSALQTVHDGCENVDCMPVGGSQVWYLKKKLLSKLYPVDKINDRVDSSFVRALNEFIEENGNDMFQQLTKVGGGRPQLI